jgi:phosphoribosylglycinamide formyltransferase-1
MTEVVLGVLASGSGTNFESIAAAIDRGEIPARIGLVLCNRPGAGVLAKASHRGLPTRLLDHREYRSRQDFDRAVAEALDEAGANVVAMAGFDRIVTGTLLARFPGRVLNIHPALLPAFPGSDAQAQALEYGVRVTGATVHFVDEAVDHGPIIVQGAIAVSPGEDLATVRHRILEVEHRIYPYALRLLVQGRLRVEGRTVHVLDDVPACATPLVSPAIPSSNAPAS